MTPKCVEDYTNNTKGHFNELTGMFERLAQIQSNSIGNRQANECDSRIRDTLANSENLTDCMEEEK